MICSHAKTMTRSAVNRYATPLTTGLFLVSMVSGVALFFHWAPNIFHQMHVWLSMVLLAPFVLHIWKNWSAMTLYWRRGLLVVPVLLALAGALAFAIPGYRSGGGPRPQARVVQLMTGATVADLAPILKTTPAALVARLQKLGVDKASPTDSLDDLSDQTDEPASKLLFGLLPAGRR